MNQQLVVFMYVLEYLMYRYKREAGVVVVVVVVVVDVVVVVVHGIDIESNVIVGDNEDDAVLV